MSMTYASFKKKYNGKYVDYDKLYGAQCWDLAQQYFIEALGLPASILSGVGNVGNMLKGSKYTTLLKYFNSVPFNSMSAGDIVIWEVGHIAIFDRWDGKQNWFFSQNTGTAAHPVGPSKVITINLKGPHAFRKKASSNTTENVYTVKKSDSDGLIALGKRLGIDWTEIAKLNNLKSPYIIKVGQVLKLPKKQTIVKTYKVVKGDTLSKISKKYGVAVSSLVSKNKTKYPKLTADYIVVGWVLNI